MPRSRTAVALVVLLAAGWCAGCSGRHTPAPRPSAAGLTASVAQFRNDEGTRRLKAGVTNSGDGDIRVTRATIAWGGLAFPTVPLPDDPVHPGQTAAFPIEYGAPRCTDPAPGRPVLVALIDGRTRRLPLHVDEPGLLDRLRAKACAAERLDAVATVRLVLSTRTERVDGVEQLPGALVLRRRPGATGRVRVVDLSGSVLLALVPRGGRAALPGTLAADQDVLRFPVLMGSTHRCDAHALGQSSQTFLISAYVRLEDEPTQRVVLPLTTAERDRLTGVIHRVCRT